VTATSNSQTVLDGLVERCNQALQRGTDASLASLEAHRDAGAALLELKELLPRGRFGPIAKARCGCSKQWRARLMQLNREWDDVQAAMRWAEGCGRDLGRKAYSVDGALALVKQWRRAECGDAPPAKSSRSAKPLLLRENALLRDRVSALKAQVALLEEELAAFAPPVSDRQDIDEPTRAKVQKIAGYWLLRGCADGERYAAVKKLYNMARPLGWNLWDLLRKCAIESPADWTLASTK
jgi:hypothetical protein